MEVKVATIHKKEMMIVKKHNRWYWFFLLPSLLGVMLFYTVPFLYSLYYALIDNMGDRHFVGFKNFIDTLANPLFQNAAWNTVKIVGGVRFFEYGIGFVAGVVPAEVEKGAYSRYFDSAFAYGCSIRDNRLFLGNYVWSKWSVDKASASVGSSS